MPHFQVKYTVNNTCQEWILVPKDYFYAWIYADTRTFTNNFSFPSPAWGRSQVLCHQCLKDCNLTKYVNLRWHESSHYHIFFFFIQAQARMCIVHSYTRQGTSVTKIMQCQWSKDFFFVFFCVNLRYTLGNIIDLTKQAKVICRGRKEFVGLRESTSTQQVI